MSMDGSCRVHARLIPKRCPVPNSCPRGQRHTAELGGGDSSGGGGGDGGPQPRICNKTLSLGPWLCALCAAWRFVGRTPLSAVPPHTSHAPSLFRTVSNPNRTNRILAVTIRSDRFDVDAEVRPAELWRATVDVGVEEEVGACVGAGRRGGLCFNSVYSVFETRSIPNLMLFPSSSRCRLLQAYLPARNKIKASGKHEMLDWHFWEVHGSFVPRGCGRETDVFERSSCPRLQSGG